MAGPALEIKHCTLNSSTVDKRTSLAVGAIENGKLYLAPIDSVVQMRPSMAHLNLSKEEKERQEAGEEEEEAVEEKLEMVSVRALDMQIMQRH